MTCVVFLILLLVHGVHSLFLGTVWGPARDQYFVRDLTLWGYLAICITFGAALPLRFVDSMVQTFRRYGLIMVLGLLSVRRGNKMLGLIWVAFFWAVCLNSAQGFYTYSLYFVFWVDRKSVV